MPKDFLIEAVGFKRTAGGTSGIFYENPAKLSSQLNFLVDNTKLKITVEVYDEKRENERLRTEAQNKYYHKLLDIICEHTGDTHLSLHEDLKIKFLGKPYVKGDKEYIVIPSTTGLNSKNFGDYLEKIFSWASQELDMTLPSSSSYY